MEVGRADIVLSGDTSKLDAALERGERALHDFEGAAVEAARKTDRSVSQANQSLEGMGKEAAATARRAVEALERIERGLDSMAGEAKQSAGSIDGSLKRIEGSLTGLNTRGRRPLEGLGEESKRTGRSFGAFAAGATAALGRATLAVGGVVAAGYAAKRATEAAVNPIKTYESSFTGVRKTVNATDAELTKLATDIRALARDDLPVSVIQLNNIAASAGQLGIETPNIARFVDTIARLGASTDLGFDEGATQLARFVNITGLGQEKISNLGSTLVALGNTTATTESQILSIGLRIAGAGKIVGLADSDILALGATLSSLGIEAEAGGSAISRLLIETAKAVRSNTKELGTFASVAGMSADEFRAAYESDAVAALDAFAQGLARLESGGGNALKVLEDLGLEDIRLRDAVLRLTSAGDLLTKSLRTSRKAFSDNTALAKESGERFKDLEQRAQLVRNKLFDLAVAAGERALPSLKLLVDTVGDLIDANRDVLDQNFEQWARGFESAVNLAVRAAEAAAPIISDTLGEIAAQIQALDLYASGRIDVSALSSAYLGNALPGNRRGFRDLVSGFKADELQGFVDADPRAAALLGAIGNARVEPAAGDAFRRVAGAFLPGGKFVSNRDNNDRGGGGGGGGGTPDPDALKSSRAELDGILDSYAQIFDAVESRAQNRLAIAQEQKASAAEIWDLELELLDLQKQSVEWQLQLAEQTGASAGEVAKLTAEYDNLLERIGVAVQGTDRMTASLGRFGGFSLPSGGGRRESVIESPYASSGLFGSGTGVSGMFSGLLSFLGIGPAAPQPLFTVAGGTAGATAAGGGFSVGSLSSFGGITSPARVATGLGGRVEDKRAEQLGLTNNKDRNSTSFRENVRAEIGVILDAARVYPTKAFAENPGDQFKTDNPALTDPLMNAIIASGFILGQPSHRILTNDSGGIYPKAFGRRGVGLGLTQDQIERDIQRIVDVQGFSLADAGYEVTREFLRYQMEGKGAQISQERYNAIIEETVRLLTDDLPAGVSAAGLALKHLEQFGDVQILAFDELDKTLEDVSDLAGSLSSGILDSIEAAAESDNIMDVGATLASRFSDAFLEQVATDLIDSGVFAGNLDKAIALYREASAAMRAGDAIRAGDLTNQLANVFAETQSQVTREAAPLQQILRGFKAATGQASAPGIIRQVDTIRVDIDGRKIAEVNLNNARLNRTVGVLSPSQVGTEV